jgi:hypothetical protein
MTSAATATAGDISLITFVALPAFNEANNNTAKSRRR